MSLRGVRFVTEESFAELFRPLMGELGGLYWLLDLQSGPFAITGRERFWQLDARLEELWVELPQLDRSSRTLWRPGIFPEFADLLVEDEWSYLFGMRGPESAAISSAVQLAEMGAPSPELLVQLTSLAEIFLLEVTHGEWEAYTGRREWRDRLVSIPGAAEVSVTKWSAPA